MSKNYELLELTLITPLTENLVRNFNMMVETFLRSAPSIVNCRIPAQIEFSAQNGSKQLIEGLLNVGPDRVQIVLALNTPIDPGMRPGSKITINVPDILVAEGASKGSYETDFSKAAFGSGHGSSTVAVSSPQTTSLTFKAEVIRSSHYAAEPMVSAQLLGSKRDAVLLYRHAVETHAVALEARLNESRSEIDL